MSRRGLDGASVMTNAATQFNVSSSPHGLNAGRKAQQIAGNFKGLSGHIGEALSLAQAAGGAGHHAVSCGWGLGRAYGCCLHRLGHIQSHELMRFVLDAADHALALSRDGHSGWNEGNIDHQFGVIAEALDGLKIPELPGYAKNVNTLAAQFAASLR